MSMSWYPGHMAKTRKLHQAELKSIDVIFYMVDARIPFSSMDPSIQTLIQHKPFIIVINKMDLVPTHYLNATLETFKTMGMHSIPISAKSKKNLKKLIQLAQSLKSKNRLIGGVGLSVLGIPNTGKSTLINALVGKNTQPTANTPGVTRALKWLKTKDNDRILDSPGLLWPKIEDEETALKIAAIGSIKDRLVPLEKVARYVIEQLKDSHKDALSELGVDLETLDPLESLAKDSDLLTAAQKVLKWFRDGKCGKVALDD